MTAVPWVAGAMLALLLAVAAANAFADVWARDAWRWIVDLAATVRWAIRWQVWRPPTRRWENRPAGARPWPLPAGRAR